MKYLILLLSLIISSFSFSQENSSKSQRASFIVKGVCEMCKDRIENATIRLKGVKYSNWEIVSNKISIIYNSKKIKLDDIHKEISLLGHSTEKYDAPDKIYNALPDCCKYKTLGIH
jgi:cation transport ATPase